MSLDTPDDVDRLYAHLAPIEPPADFVRRVATATYAAQTPAPIRRRLWLLLDAAALLVLAALSVSLGIALRETGALDLIELLVLDLDSAREGFGAIVEALLGTLPWLQVLLLLVNVGAVALLSRLALGERARSVRGAA
jgi:hypothetical protein